MAVPAPPTGLLVTAGFGCAQVRWTAPVSSNTVPQVTQYTVTTSPADVPPVVLVPWATGFKPPVVTTIGGLTQGTSYTFTVTATNTSGTSPASTATPTIVPGSFGDGYMDTLSHLTGELSNDFIQKLGLNPPVMFIGPQYLTNRDDAMRIVFVPVGGNIVPGELLGDDDVWSTLGSDLPTPRQIWDDQEVTEAHIWGLQLPTQPPTDVMHDTIAGYAQARFLALRMQATLHRITIGSDWSLSDMYPRGRDKTTRGAAIVVRFKTLHPVTQYNHSTGVVTSFLLGYAIGDLFIAPQTPQLLVGSELQFTPQGGTGGYVWSLSSAPSGGNINAATGLYTAGDAAATDTVELTDSSGTHVTTTVQVLAPVVVGPSTTTVDTLGTQAFTATGGTGSYTWDISPNNSGGSIDPDGNYTAGSTGGVDDTVVATDTLGNQGTADVTVNALSPVVVSPHNPGVQVGGGTQVFTATGGTGLGYTWLITVNQSGSNIDPSSGFYTAGNSIGHDTVQATDSGSNTGISVVNVFAD